MNDFLDELIESNLELVETLKQSKRCRNTLRALEGKQEELLLRITTLTTLLKSTGVTGEPEGTDET